MSAQVVREGERKIGWDDVGGGGDPTNNTYYVMYRTKHVLCSLTRTHTRSSVRRATLTCMPVSISPCSSDCGTYGTTLARTLALSSLAGLAKIDKNPTWDLHLRNPLWMDTCTYPVVCLCVYVLARGGKRGGCHSGIDTRSAKQNRQLIEWCGYFFPTPAASNFSLDDHDKQFILLWWSCMYVPASLTTFQ